MAFISRLKQLSQGTLRLLVFISFLIPITFLVAAMAVERPDVFILISIISFFIFWIIVRTVLWIQDGYKEDAKK
ncbi:hypothetical protein [Flavobacterium sp. NRK1]|jgi:hypothetical protein|uniref:hypothetical protein n=1 Tax=Flavobacterium sp. NRK1 TaxID=2954929 RepID=UPI002092E410|nr:hypothetical protein [Flavobacterium sp. NRK1]MCO6147391.1 hypothetical protein [Flavobacterium sp. NRK1]